MICVETRHMDDKPAVLQLMTTPEKRADIAERFGWQEGEREALQREMTEWAQRIARDETLRCHR